MVRHCSSGLRIDLTPACGTASAGRDLGSAEILQIAYFGKDQIVHFLDLLDSEEVMDKVSAFRQMGMMDP